jgi:hypothetical protein
MNRENIILGFKYRPKLYVLYPLTKKNRPNQGEFFIDKVYKLMSLSFPFNLILATYFG